MALRMISVRVLVTFFLLIIAFGIATQAADAARVTPMVVEMKPTGRESVARIQLTNDADRDIAYEVQMMRGAISPDGELSLTPADEDFIVFPPQALVEGLSQQVFRIQYVGEAALAKSQIYYLSIKQVPVAFDENSNQVQLVINFNVLVIVEPDGGSVSPSVLQADYVERPKSGDDDALMAYRAALAAGETDNLPPVEMERGVVVDVANSGDRLFRAARSQWTITGRTTAGDAFELVLGADEMTRLLGVGVVAPESNRRFFIPLEEKLEPGSVRVAIAN